MSGKKYPKRWTSGLSLVLYLYPTKLVKKVHANVKDYPSMRTNLLVKWMDAAEISSDSEPSEHKTLKSFNLICRRFP